MNKDKLLDLFSKMSFTTLVICWLLGVAGMLALVWPRIAGYLALDKPTLENGRENSILIIDAIEAYKEDHGFYPPSLRKAAEYNLAVLDYRYDYKYETYPTNDSPQEYMLSFRKRWTLDGWYCYYSGDPEWRQSQSTCWPNPRPTNEPIK